MSIELFKNESLKVLEIDGKGRKEIGIVFVWSVCFVATGEAIVAYAKTVYDSGDVAILTKYIKTKGNNWARKTVEGNGENWEAQLFLDSEEVDNNFFCPVAKNGIVYVLVAGNDKFMFSSNKDPATLKGWTFNLSVGTITDGGNAGKKKRIVWNTKDVTDLFLKDTEIRKRFQRITTNHGFSFLMEDGTFVFVFYVYGDSKGDFYLIAYSTDPDNGFTFHMDCPAEEDVIFFPWGKTFVLVPDGERIRRRNYKPLVSNDMGRTWGELTGPLAENLKKVEGLRLGFTPITIGKRRVLLFAKPPKAIECMVYDDDDDSCDDSSEKKDDSNSCDDSSEEGPNSCESYLNLFILDDEHFQKVGRFFCDHRGYVGGKFLYTNDELFFLQYSTEDEHDKPALFIRLDEQLKKIKLLLEEWYPGDEEHATGPAEPAADVSEKLKELAVTKTSRKE